MTLHAGLVESANTLVEEIRQTLSTGDYPSSDVSGRGYVPIEETIEIGEVRGSLREGQLAISIGIGGETAPYTRAFEFGSGIHAERGAREKYPIVPREAPFLAFPVGPPPGRWPRYDPSYPGTGGLETGEYIYLQAVEHPGIEAKPFIRPSIANTSERIRQILGQSFKTEIMLGVERITVIR